MVWASPRKPAPPKTPPAVAATPPEPPRVVAPAAVAPPAPAEATLRASKLPPDVVGPITQVSMSGPVTAADRFTYEREAIEEWLRDHDISPLTGERLAHTQLTPNLVLRSLIQEYREAQG